MPTEDAQAPEGISPEELNAALAEADREEAAWRDANTPPDVRAAKPQRPDNVPEQFWKDGKVDVDALLAAHNAKPEEKPEAKPEAKPEEGEELGVDKDKKSETEESDETETINNVEVTEEDYQTWAPFYEAVRKGEALPEEAYKIAKERFGVSSREMVDDYMRGRIAQSEAASATYATSVKDAAGGAEGYKAVTAWAADVLTDAEIAEYNAAVHSGNLSLAKAATQALHYRFKAEGGKPPALLGGRTAAAPSDGYASMDDMVNAISDPRYDKDPAYRAEVERKIAASEGRVSPTKGSRAY